MPKKSPQKIEREIAEYLKTGERDTGSSPFRESDLGLPRGGSRAAHGTDWPTGRRYRLVDADTGKDMRDALDFEVAQIRASRHGVVPLALRGGTYQVRLRDPDEKFAVMDRNLSILGESRSVNGAMQKAPDDKSYALVRGEYTSDGRYWGLGRGRLLAVREFQPQGGLRWHVG